MQLKQQQQLLSSIQQKTLPFPRGQENRNQEKKSKRKKQPRNPIKERDGKPAVSQTRKVQFSRRQKTTKPSTLFFTKQNQKNSCCKQLSHEPNQDKAKPSPLTTSQKRGKENMENRWRRTRKHKPRNRRRRRRR